MNKFLLAVLAISLIGNIYFIYRNQEQNRVVRVIDGDSVDLKDGRRIRLLGIDAPEKDRCMNQEARNKLQQLTTDKRIQLTDTITDDYGRILANVFVNNIFVNKIMVENGLARFVYVKSPRYDELKQAAQAAKSEHRGIYSPLCRVSVNADCLIKGNIRAGVKVYHLPNCDNYDQVIVDTAFGDTWFCAEEEAIRGGFRKAAGCVKL